MFKTELPVILGNEEESGLLVTDANSTLYSLNEGKPINQICMIEPHDIANNLKYYVPEELKYENQTHEFYRNGFRLYAGGARGNPDYNPERATPECITPSQLNNYLRAGERLFDKIIENYAIYHAEDNGLDFTVRWQRRVVDSLGNGKGCHDNFGFNNSAEDIYEDLPYSSLFYNFISSSSFITGAGLFGTFFDDSCSFSQKIPGLYQFTGKQYFGSMIHTYPDIDDAFRVEIRCSDINISDWAVLNRIGSTAMFLTLLQTGANDKLEALIKKNNINDISLVDVKYMVDMDFKPSESIKLTDFQKKGLDLQILATELFIDYLPDVIDMPDDYWRIARQRQQYLVDFANVVDGKYDIELLADRSDWAAKLLTIRKRIDSDKNFNFNDKTINTNTRLTDFMYDIRQVTSSPDGELKWKIGTGYKIRDRKIFKSTAEDYAIEYAYFNPPKETRAKLRADILEDHDSNYLDWRCIQINKYIGNCITDNLEVCLDPLQQELAELQIHQIYEFYNN